MPSPRRPRDRRQADEKAPARKLLIVEGAADIVAVIKLSWETLESMRRCAAKQQKIRWLSSQLVTGKYLMVFTLPGAPYAARERVATSNITVIMGAQWKARQRNTPAHPQTRRSRWRQKPGRDIDADGSIDDQPASPASAHQQNALVQQCDACTSGPGARGRRGR